MILGESERMGRCFAIVKCDYREDKSAKVADFEITLEDCIF
jgi:hypothetical protein